MRKTISTRLLIASLLISVVVAAPSYSATKPIKSNFSNMKELLASMKAKGIVCDTYEKTPAEGAIEEGVCSIMSKNVLITLVAENSFAKDLADASVIRPDINFGGRIYVFYSNNFRLMIKDPKRNNKLLEVSNLLQKKLGIKYRVGTA